MAAYYNTRNPIPSIDPRDLSDNAQNFDLAMNTRAAESWADRFAVARKSWFGMEQDFQRFLANSGYQNIGPYAAGLVITSMNQVFVKDGELYRASASLTLPYTLTGDWPTEGPNFVSVGDASLRQDLANPALGVSLVAGSIRYVDTIAQLRTMNAVANPFVWAIGYYARGTIQSAYAYAPADTTSADDGGSVIVTATGQRYHLIIDGPVYAEQWGAVGDGSDSTTRIQTAIDFCAPRGIPLHFGPGTFGLNLNRTEPVEGYALARCALVCRDKMVLRGSGFHATSLRLMDGQTDLITTTIPWFNLITNNIVARGVSISDIALDMNGQNNPISRPGAELPGFTCAGFMTTGSVASVGVDARLYDSFFERIWFKNTPGVTNISVGSRYNHPGTAGENNTIRDCVFSTSGVDSQDHSSVFSMGNYTTVENNWFDNPTPSTGVRGPVVAVELHGTGNRMSNNRVRNYCQVFWIGTGEDGQRFQTTVEGNIGVVTWWGGGFYSDPVMHDPMADTVVRNNNIWVTGDTILQPHLTGPKHGLYLAMGYGSVTLRSKIYDNLFYCTDRVNNMFTYIGADTGTVNGSLEIDGNFYSGFSRGILIGAAAGSIAALHVRNNTGENFAVTTATPLPDTFGIRVSNTSMFSLHLSGNVASSGEFGTQPAVAIDLAATATISRLYMDGNDGGDSGVEISDLCTVTGRRMGRQARQFTALPAQSTWRIGDTAYLHPAPLLGAGGSQYIMDGWQRMTDGTSNVLNTDWRERRMLTGT